MNCTQWYKWFELHHLYSQPCNVYESIKNRNLTQSTSILGLLLRSRKFDVGIEPVLAALIPFVDHKRYPIIRKVHADRKDAPIVLNGSATTLHEFRSDSILLDVRYIVGSFIVRSIVDRSPTQLIELT